jgi:hypothetical protein
VAESGLEFSFASVRQSRPMPFAVVELVAVTAPCNRGFLETILYTAKNESFCTQSLGDRLKLCFALKQVTVSQCEAAT